jgi:hypothetical protein
MRSRGSMRHCFKRPTPSLGLLTLFVAQSVFAEGATKDNTASSDTLQACIDQHEALQVTQANGDLLKAAAQAQSCASLRCPAEVRSDCFKGLTEIRRLTPSVVLAASSPEGDEANVAVTMDGTPLVHELNGNALDVNPGRHEFTFTLAPYPPQTAVAVLRSGEKERIVAVSFGNPKPPPAPARQPAPQQSPSVLQRIPWPTYALGALALASAGVGIGAGLSASDLRKTAQRDCSPFCGEATVDRVKYRGYLADASFGVALAAGAAAIWFAVQNTEPVAAPISVLPLQQGALLAIGGAF